MHTLRRDHLDLPSGGYFSSWLWYFVLPFYGDVIYFTLIFSSAEVPFWDFTPVTATMKLNWNKIPFLRLSLRRLWSPTWSAFVNKACVFNLLRLLFRGNNGVAYRGSNGVAHAFRGNNGVAFRGNNRAIIGLLRP